MKTSTLEKASWKFVTPQNKSLILRMKERVTLYDTNHPPRLELIAYNAPSKARNFSLCPVSLEQYGKIEVFLKNGDIQKISPEEKQKEAISAKLSAQEEFFYSGIDTLIGDKK